MNTGWLINRGFCIPVITAGYLMGTSLLSGCGSSSGTKSDPAQPVLSGVVTLVVRAADYVNPDTYGRPCPVVVRLYQISDCSVLRQYRFLDIYNQADHFLGARLLSMRALNPLHPGQSLTMDLPLVKGAGCLAAYAGYSQYRDGSPFATLPLSSSATVQLTLEGLRVVLVRSH